MAEPSIPEGFDFTDPDLYLGRMPAEEFAELRRTAPVWWNAQPRGASGFDDEGYWVVTKHADVLEVSRNSEVYSSEEKTAIIRHAQSVTDESLGLQRLIMLNIDPPQHTKLRGIVSRGFTPRAIGNLREALTARAERIVRTALAEGTGDFVTDVAAELPLQAIAELLGIPQEDRGKIFAWSNEMIGYDDPDYGGDSQAAAAELVGYAMTMAEDRRGCDHHGHGHPGPVRAGLPGADPGAGAPGRYRRVPRHGRDDRRDGQLRQPVRPRGHLVAVDQHQADGPGARADRRGPAGRRPAGQRRHPRRRRPGRGQLRRAHAVRRRVQRHEHRPRGDLRAGAVGDPFSDEDEAARIANDTRYGLAATVWTSDVRRAIRMTKAIRAGTVGINGYQLEPHAAFGGYQQSGLGREGGRTAVESYTEVKTVLLPFTGAMM